MAYKIEEQDAYTEVQVWGYVGLQDIIAILSELCRRDPEKARPDLWMIASECQVPLSAYSSIAEATRGMVPARTGVKRSAMVATDAFHRAQLDMYCVEARNLPFQIRVFATREEAIPWLLTAEPPQPGAWPRSPDGVSGSIL
jgi:hypothetical protein